MQTPEWVSTFSPGERDLIVLTTSMSDEEIDDTLQALHGRFPNNMILFLNPGETIEARSEEEAVEILKAIADHSEYREHKALTEEPQ